MQKHSTSCKLGAAALAITGIVQRRWGTAAAAGFLVGVVVNYPFFMGRVEVLQNVDVSYFIQASVAGSIPLLYLYHPKGAPVYIPIVCTALALAILKQMWDQAVLIRELSQQNNKFEELVKQLEATAEKLESAIKHCLEQSKEAEKSSSTATEVIEEADNRLARLNAKFVKIIEVFELANKPEDFVVRLKSVRTHQQNLDNLIERVQEKQHAIDRLNQEFQDLNSNLKQVIDSLSQDQHQLKENLVKLEGKLKEFIGKTP